jgi:glucosamine--fructose-6-phosphate aminotransferase (isomerizing)
VLLALTHTGTRKRYTAAATEAARGRGMDVVQVSGEGVAGADLVTVAQERSAAYTASHLGAMVRVAQLASVLGAPLGDLAAISEAVDRAFAGERPAFRPPARLVELTGGGIDAWTAAEGALKIREAAYVASEGLSVEQLLHGPSVALGGQDHLVCLDGGGAFSARVGEVADAAERSGTPVTRIRSELPEPLSLFPLTVAVQRIALEAAEALGVNPDTFGRDVAGREPWAQIEL